MIEEHSWDDCTLCKGALANQRDHYALGRLRLTIGAELGLSREALQELALSELLARRRVRLQAGRA